MDHNIISAPRYDRYLESYIMIYFSLLAHSGVKGAKVHLEIGWNSKRMITEGEAAIPLETTLHAFRNQEKTKQRSTIGKLCL